MLFTDIVDSTERAVALGDRRWRELLDAHDAAARAEIDARPRPRREATGDGFLAAFDGPARADPLRRRRSPDPAAPLGRRGARRAAYRRVRDAR